MTTLADRWNIQPDHIWLRGRQPEHVVQEGEDGIVNVYGYPEASAVLTDPEAFSNDVDRLMEGDQALTGKEDRDGSLLGVDPPEHTRMRKLVGHAFTPSMITRLAPRIAELTRNLLDEAGGSDRLDLVESLTYPLPVIVICEILGVPTDDLSLFREWVDRMARSASGLFDGDEDVDIAAAQRRVPEMLDYLAELVADRRKSPRADLIGDLIHADVDGERVTDRQIVTFLKDLIVVGHATTSAVLGNAVLCLDAHPEVAARVRADRSLVPGVFEETLRYLAPGAMAARATTRDVEIGGLAVGPDRLVMNWLGACNRDPRQFDRPHEFDPARDPNPHLAFSRGIHFCLGAPLARIEGRIVLNELLDRYRELRVDPGEPPVFLPLPFVIGVTDLVVRTA
ncbi:cytochrome P450 [Amycolatopsis sp. VS8301801F10]|uniref:cytochrome P450 n=1 Tax=Amycolatopsis sp. VS8301801F10 TaxID=2652442 RepID=UPI0038FD038F